MAVIRDRTGDFTKKKHLYKFYKNGYTSRQPKYMTTGQYLASSGEFISGSVIGNASVSGGYGFGSLNVTGSGDSNFGISFDYKESTDPRRKVDIKNVIAVFAHSGGATGAGSLTFYEIQLFDYKIRRTTSGNTVKAFYKSTELASATMAAGYTYIRMRESGGTMYIERSTDGNSWTAWTSHVIDFDDDITRSVLSIEVSGGAGGIGNIFGTAYDIDISDRNNQLLAVETSALNDLEYTETIDNPASSTTIDFPYNPLFVPDHFAEGNFIEIYTNFYDDGVIQNESILDHNGSPILDQNSEPIQGIVLHGNVPEETSILKFSGYVSSIDYDYDNELISVTFISHGETMANSVVRGDEISVTIASQLLQNNTVATANRRQTFTLDKMTKVDEIALYIQYGGGGTAQITVGAVGGPVYGSSMTRSWSGSIDSVLSFYFPTSMYLPAGQYYIQENSGVNWKYQNANVFEGGSMQTLSGSVWIDTTDDAYMQILSYQPELALALSGTSQEIAAEIFEKSLELDYSPLYLEEVQDAGYNINIALNIDSSKNAINALYRQLPTGWFYHVNIGTNAVRIKDRNAEPDHFLVFGRDFTGMKVKKDIDGIINDVFFIGGEIIEGGPKLTAQTTDIDSISDYRHGLSIMTNDKVTRYDTAELLSDYEIGNNNAPRLSTEITLSAARYNTETVQIGDIVKIANGDGDVLKTTLVVADKKYKSSELVISLDSAPRNLSRTIDSIQRDLENTNTAAAGAVV